MADGWVASVEVKMSAFAQGHQLVFNQTARQVAASFEIGCFHALSEFYSETFTIVPQNLTEANEYRYLTTPSGNPENFSFLRLLNNIGAGFELRQQVRVRSHLHADITFTPDLIVLHDGATVHAERNEQYASGK